MKKTAIALVGLLAVAGGAAAVAQNMGQGGGMMGEGMRGERGHGDRGWSGDGRRGDGEHRGRWGRGERHQPTEAELDARIRERFARLDGNSDGVIDRAEVEQALATARGQRNRNANEPNRQMRFDTDKDGKVSKAEVLARVETRFKRMDLNNDGRITDDDLPPMMRGRNVLKGDAAGGMMGGRGGGGLGWLRAADADKNGQITLDEARAVAEQQFALRDRTKDGALDQADRDAMAKEMTEYRVQRFLHAHGAGSDGKVTREQFTTAAKERMAERGFGMGDGMGDGRGPRGRGHRHEFR